MIPGMNPRDVEKAMKRMGIKQDKLDAIEVIIRLSDKELVIRNPEVLKINMMGQQSFQISGDIEERAQELFSQEDVDTIVEQTGCSEDEAREALESEGDLAAAILKIKGE